MLVSEIKPIGKVGKNLLENKNADEVIDIIIEKPLQKACKQCKEKNIETVMSSANKKNILKEKQKRVTRKSYLDRAKKHKLQNFFEAGKGYAWLMINYNTLSDENREIIFSLEKELGEEIIWFVKSPPKELLPAEARVMTIPAAIDINKDGNCDAKPSPIVNTVYLLTASAIGI